MINSCHRSERGPGRARRRRIRRRYALLDLASSANIACAEHAGSAEVMRRTVALALERGVSIGAHPVLSGPGRIRPARAGHSRRGRSSTAYERQLESIATCCDGEGARLRYVKPHGALYNRAAKDARARDVCLPSQLARSRSVAGDPDALPKALSSCSADAQRMKSVAA